MPHDLTPTSPSQTPTLPSVAPIPLNPLAAAPTDSIQLQLAAIEARLTEEFALSLSKAKREMERNLKAEIKKAVKKELVAAGHTSAAKDAKEAREAAKGAKTSALASSSKEDKDQPQQQGRWPKTSGKIGDSFAAYKLKKRGGFATGGGSISRRGKEKRGFVPAKQVAASTNMFAALEQEESGGAGGEAGDEEKPQEKEAPKERKKLVLAPRSKPKDESEVAKEHKGDDGIASESVVAAGQSSTEP